MDFTHGQLDGQLAAFRLAIQKVNDALENDPRSPQLLKLRSEFGSLCARVDDQLEALGSGCPGGCLCSSSGTCIDCGTFHPEMAAGWPRRENAKK